MALAKITKIRGRGAPVPGDDIDTDRIIPARFLKCVTFDGLGAHAFRDDRFAPDGTPKGHPLDDPRYRGASILVAGRNFGCGSSREHAPQSLWYAGFRAILAESFAEIFFGNSTTIGLPCVTLSRPDREALTALLQTDPAADVEVDLEASGGPAVRCGGRVFAGSLPEASRRALVEGQWDPLAQLLDGASDAARLAERLPKPAA